MPFVSVVAPVAFCVEKEGTSFDSEERAAVIIINEKYDSASPLMMESTLPYYYLAAEKYVSMLCLSIF